MEMMGLFLEIKGLCFGEKIETGQDEEETLITPKTSW